MYPSEHYEAWQRELAPMELPWGMFGENLTVREVANLLFAKTPDVGHLRRAVTLPGLAEVLREYFEEWLTQLE